MSRKFGYSLPRYGRQMRFKSKKRQRHHLVPLSRWHIFLTGFYLLIFAATQFLLRLLYKKYATR